MSYYRTGSNENISTFGDGTRDYTSVSTWESAVDNDNVTAEVTEVLECYADSASFDQRCIFAGGTYNATYPLIVRAEENSRNKLRKNAGIVFIYTTTNAIVFDVRTQFTYFFDLGISLQPAADTATRGVMQWSSTSHDGIVGGCLLFDATNPGTGEARGIVMSGDSMRWRVVNTQFRDIESHGFNASGAGGGDGIMVNCGALDCGGDNLRVSGTHVIKNSYADGAGSSDFAGWDAASDRNASGDGTAPGTTVWTSQTVTVTSANDGHLSPLDTSSQLRGASQSTDSDFAFNTDVDVMLRTGSWDLGPDQINFSDEDQREGELLLMRVGS